MDHSSLRGVEGGLEVEVASGVVGFQAWGGDFVAAFLYGLVVDVDAAVGAFDEVGVFEAGHHLVEGGEGFALGVLGEFGAEVAAGALGAAEDLEDEELKMRESWDRHIGAPCALEQEGRAPYNAGLYHVALGCQEKQAGRVVQPAGL